MSKGKKKPGSVGAEAGQSKGEKTVSPRRERSSARRIKERLAFVPACPAHRRAILDSFSDARTADGIFSVWLALLEIAQAVQARTFKVSLNRLCRITGVSERKTVRNRIRKLEEIHFVTVKKDENYYTEHAENTYTIEASWYPWESAKSSKPRGQRARGLNTRKSRGLDPDSVPISLETPPAAFQAGGEGGVCKDGKRCAASPSPCGLEAAKEASARAALDGEEMPPPPPLAASCERPRKRKRLEGF